jgi:signal transduction histidine kinase
VNFVMPGQFFFLQDGTAGVRVESTATNVQVGDIVEVAGFIDTSRSIAGMTEAVARRLGNAPVPKAELVTVRDLLRPEIQRRSEPGTVKDCAGGTVKISGLLSDVEFRPSERQLILFLTSDGHRFKAFLPSTNSAAKRLWAPGSVVEVTGACDLEFKPAGSGARGAIVNDFSIWLRTPQDVVILEAAPWWTPLRLGLTLGGTLAILAVTLGWVWLLRRQVAHQMEVIKEKLQGEAVSAERNRIARDLHDNLEQQLAGVALQLDGAEETIRQDPAEASDAVRLARRMLRHTQAEARRSVWDLRSQVLELQGLPAALEALAESTRSRSGLAITTQILGENSSLPAVVEFQILRVAQEALANALKHSGAKRIVISLEFNAENICLRVSDDGRGLTPDKLTHEVEPHFGVLGMQERAARLGGQLAIVGAPGAGCVVTLTLPRDVTNIAEPVTL